MMTPKLIPDITEEEKTPLVTLLMNIISQQTELIRKQTEEIQLLKDEIARVKKKPPKPKISPSTMDPALPRKARSRKERKRRKRKPVEITETVYLHPTNLPENSRFRKYKDFIVQDIRLDVHTVKYRRGKWKTPEGNYITTPLPDHIQGHFGPALKTFIVYLNHGLNVTQPLICELMEAIGIQISKGMVNDILTEDKDGFHQEKEEILRAGLALSNFIVVDDTGARHAGKNGYCTHIGNDFFAYFKSTSGKSRINFLRILRQDHRDYILNADALRYLTANELPESTLSRIRGALESGRTFEDDQKWNEFLKMVGIRNEAQVKLITEAALAASVLFHGFNEELVIVSDEAGQFDVFLHALCWIHAERKIKEILPINDYQKEVIEKLLGKLWELYRDLKQYKENPNHEKKQTLEYRFDVLCSTETDFEVINSALLHLWKNKKKLLLVLDRPEIPLNNNISENDIRSMVQKRKVHGGTRGMNGRLARDTFISLKKTAKKLGISFYDYLYDRIAKKNNISPLHEVVISHINSYGLSARAAPPPTF